MSEQTNGWAPGTWWLEISCGTDNHGGPGWELGACVWSPTKRQWGGYVYMLEPVQGDFFIHCYNGMLVGMSRVAHPCRETINQPPLAGRWAKMGSYYRIELTGYQPFQKQVLLRDFVAHHCKDIRLEIEADHPARYPFCVTHSRSITGRVSTVQGRLIARITPKLLAILCKSVEIAQCRFP